MRVLVLAFSCALTACSTTAVDLSYQPMGVQPQPAAKPVVAVGAFTDGRKHDSNWLGAIRGGYGNPLKTLTTPAPVKDVVRAAFVEGLKARGLYNGEADAYRLSGVVQQFDCNQYGRREAHIDLLLTVQETATRKIVMSQRYKRDMVTGSMITFDAGIFASVEDLRVVAHETLQSVVNEALDSAEFREAIAGANNPAGAGVTS